MTPTSENKPQQETADALTVCEIRKQYGHYEVLKGVSLTARKGDVISILGSSGSGKSTFLRCLNFLDPPTSGDIWINGVKLQGNGQVPCRKEINALRANVGMVFQSFNLWHHKTVIQNLIEAPIHVLKLGKDEAYKHAGELLQRVGLQEKPDAYPSQLSGGQQQRVAIARSLAMRPKILLFDEPTSALDPELVGEVLSVIRDIAGEGTTMLIVTHELSFARQVSSRIVFFHDGRIEEEASPDAFFESPSSLRLKKFLSSQREGR